MNTEGFEKLHKLSFSTPSLFVTLAILSFTVTLMHILNLGVLNFLAFSIILLLLKPVLRIKFNLNRYLFFLTFISISTLLTNAISRYLNVNPSGIFVAFVTTTVLYYMAEAEIIEVLVASFVASFVFYPNPATIVGVFFGIIFINFMNKNINGYNLRLCFKSFLLSWLTNDPSYFESFLKRHAKSFKGWIKCLRIGNVKLVTTSFHPGPMRNIGGARLVERINSLKDTVFLHSPTDHSLNPASAEDVDKLISSIVCDGIEIKPMKPFDLESENYVLTVFPFDKVRLMFVSGKNCLDDLPYELNVDRAIVVDAHNAYCTSFKPNVEELKELVKKGMEFKSEFCNVKYAFKKFRVETRSICGSVAVLLLDYGFERYAIVVIDGNNVKLEFRREVEEFCAKRGFKAIVASTDNHSKTGISTKFTYLPVGSDERDRVIFDILEKCFKLNFEDCNVSFSKRDVVIDVVGEDFCKFINEAEKMSVSIAKLYFALLATSFALSIIL
ncbi:DUF2070 family protein [Archaeoglobus sp.]